MKSRVTGMGSAIFLVVKCVLNLNSAIPGTMSCTNLQIFQEPRTKGQAMSLVLCITRSGKAGIQVQDEAIALAKERSLRLVFLYVVDISFLNKIAVGIFRRTAKKGLAQMGNFILAIALARAQTKGVDAEAVIRSGVLRDVLPQVVREMKATAIFLEHPVGETCRFDDAELERFLASSRAGRNE
jgi:hypothetical protein